MMDVPIPVFCASAEQSLEEQAHRRLRQLGLDSLAAVFDLIPCGLSVATDPSCRTIIHNRAGSRFLRIQPGENFSLTADTQPQLQVFQGGRLLSVDELPLNRAATFGQTVQSQEYECVWADGVRKTGLWSVQPLRDAGGSIFGAIATIEDLTQQKQVERERDGLMHRLQIHHQLLDGVMNHTTIALCTLDRELKVRWCNTACLQFLQRPLSAVIAGENFCDLVLDAAELQIPAAIQQVFRSGLRVDLTELRAPRLGSPAECYWNLTITPFRASEPQDGPLVLLAMSDVTTNVQLKQELQRHRDQLAELVAERTGELETTNAQLRAEVTRREQVSEQLRKSSQQTLDILESIGDAFLAVDDRFNITYANQAALQHYARSREQLIGMNLAELSAYWHTGEYKPRFEQVLRTKQPAHFEAFGNLSRRWVSMHVYPAAEGLSLFFRDVTARREAFAAASRLASIVEHAYVGIIYLGLDGLVRAWNPGAERVFGYTAEEMLGQSLARLGPPGQADEPQQLINRVLAGEKIMDLEAIRRHKDGSLREISLVSSPVRDSHGQVIGVSSIVQDISERKRVEREFRRLDRLNLAAQLAAGIGHEIRNPLTTVRGFLQFLGMKPKFAAEKEYLQLMIDELDRANSIITEFLSLSKGKPVDRQMLSLAEIIQHIVPLIQADAMLRGHELELDLAEVPALLVEEKDIRQLLLNLVRNGLEAMPQGGRLTIRTRRQGDQVRLEVSDRGSGIPAEYLDKIYLPFFSTKDGGTGLGLAVCYRIADQHGATIEIATGESGTTFAVVFPLPDA